MAEEKQLREQDISEREHKRNLAGVGGGTIPGNGENTYAETGKNATPSAVDSGTHDLVGGPVQGKLAGTSPRIPHAPSGDQDATHGSREGHEPDEEMRDPMSARSPEKLKQPTEQGKSEDPKPEH